MPQSDQFVHVNLNDRSYDIRIGENCLTDAAGQICRWLKLNAPGELRAMLVCDQAIAANHGRLLVDSFRSNSTELHVAQIPSGETSKSYEQMQRLYDALVEMAADRKTILIALGGGVIGDLAGFVAATYARGLKFIQVPTTLLSMVDSSVGGKTGINHPRGKNLIGAFHQPAGVLIDISTLNTLPDREYRSGLAEVVKYGVILDADFMTFLENHVDHLNGRNPETMRQVVARSCRLKADVVEQDEFERIGLRAVLNYGHTFGHAFEALAGYGELLHGEAVAMGMICASRLAERLGRISADDTLRQVKLLTSLGLPVTVPDSIASRTDEILRCMMLDKKTEGRELRFVLPSRIGHVETVRGVTADLALACLDG